MTGIRKLELGTITVTLLDGGALKLDGGAMFGIIPKPLWMKRTPADQANRIPLACNCLLLEWIGETTRRAIIETGLGDKYENKEREMLGIDASCSRWLLTSLRAANVDPATITDVVLTHLHFDHGGGLTHCVDGAAVPTFPNARVHVQRDELDDARANFGIMHNTYREQNLAPLDAADAWRPLDGDEQILPGVRALRTPGHTRGHHSILIEGGERSAVFAGDVMPTAAHVGAPYNMGYDLFPLENRESKRRLLADAAAAERLLIIVHEPVTPVVRVVRDDRWFVLEPS